MSNTQKMSNIQEEELKLNEMLLDAIKNKDVAQMISLLKQGANPNFTIKDKGCMSLLMVAVCEGDKDVVLTLIRNGADLNYTEVKRGTTALIFAATMGNSDVVAMLIKEGANVHIKTKSGSTAMLSAIKGGHPIVVKILLNNKALMEPEERNRCFMEAEHFEKFGGFSTDVVTFTTPLKPGAFRGKHHKEVLLEMKRWKMLETLKEEMLEKLKKIASETGPTFNVEKIISIFMNGIKNCTVDFSALEETDIQEIFNLK